MTIRGFIATAAALMLAFALQGMAKPSHALAVPPHTGAKAPTKPQFIRLFAPAQPDAETTQGDNPGHIYVTSWGITLATDGTGFYNDLARFLLDEKTTDKQYHIAPYRRAMRGFLEDAESCVYPKNVDALYRTGDWGEHDRLIESDGLLKSPIRVFTPVGQPTISQEADLSGKRIAYAMGAKIPHSVHVADAIFIPVADEVDKAKLLKRGTVDAIVANLPDALFVFRHLKEPLPPYDQDYLPVPPPVIRIVCHDTPNNRAFMERFNARLKQTVKSGALAHFFDQNGLDPKTYMPPAAH